MCWILPGTSNLRNLAGTELARCGMCRSPTTNTNCTPECTQFYHINNTNFKNVVEKHKKMSAVKHNLHCKRRLYFTLARADSLRADEHNEQSILNSHSCGTFVPFSVLSEYKIAFSTFTNSADSLHVLWWPVYSRLWATIIAEPKGAGPMSTEADAWKVAICLIHEYATTDKRYLVV